MLEAENKVGTATDLFAAFANEVWMLIIMCVVGATFGTKRVYRSAVGYIDGMCNAILDKGLQCAVNGYPVGRERRLSISVSDRLRHCVIICSSTNMRMGVGFTA